jgi:hypothetical protein
VSRHVCPIFFFINKNSLHKCERVLLSFVTTFYVSMINPKHFFFVGDTKNSLHVVIIALSVSRGSFDIKRLSCASFVAFFGFFFFFVFGLEPLDTFDMCN